MSHRSNGHCELKPIAKIKLRLLAPSVLNRLNNLGIIPSFINGRRRSSSCTPSSNWTLHGHHRYPSGKIKNVTISIWECIDIGLGGGTKKTLRPCSLPRETKYSAASKTCVKSLDSSRYNKRDRTMVLTI